MWVVVCAAAVGCAAIVGCATETGASSNLGNPGNPDPGDPGDGAPVPEVRCDAAPATGAAAGFHHVESGLIAALGDPKHRGLDLVTSLGAPGQTLEGWISYTFLDKALEDEDVEVFACDAGRWYQVGTARTGGDGRFSLELSGADRLGIGLRDLFVSVVGDRTSARFLAYVAPPGATLVVSDVDGTLTASENAFLETVASGTEPAARAGAAAVFAAAAGRGRQLVYVTARGGQYTTATRDWLEHQHFPRGPLRLAPSFLTLPGADTVAYKTGALRALTAAGFALSAGVGNRASDVTAYRNVGLAADRVFVELPEYEGELQPLLEGHQAVGFSSYSELTTRL
jgi:hypothetical protein